MQHAAALLTLLQKLPLLGISDESFTVDQEPDGIRVLIDFDNGNRIVISVSAFWKYPGVSCYFVNFRHPSGDFVACSGTPHIEMAIFNIGYCKARFIYPKETGRV